MNKKSLFFIGLLLCFALLVGTASAYTETCTVVYCTDQTTYPFSQTDSSGNVGVTVTLDGGYYRYYPALEGTSSKSLYSLSGSPSSYTWQTVYGLGDGTTSSSPTSSSDGYLGTNGNSYINTGVYANQDTGITGKVWINTSITSSDVPIFGSRVAYGNNQYQIFHSGLGNENIIVAYGTSRFDTGGFVLGTYYLNIDKNIFELSDDLTFTFSTQSFTNTYTLDLFASNNGGTHEWNAPSGSIKYYYLDIYSGGTSGTKIRSYIPIQIGTSGEYALYDISFKDNGNTKVIYTNDGTGTFSGGGTQSALTYEHAIAQPTITITQQPSIIVDDDTTITATVQGTAGGGGTLSYQWYVSKDSGTYTSISGQTSTTLSYTPLSTGIYTFRCIVSETGTYLTATATTNSVRVVTAPTVSTTVSVSPTQGNLSTAYTPTFTFTISSLGNAQTVYYKLQTSTDGTTYTDVSGKTGTATATGSKSITSASVTDTSAKTHYYRVLVSSMSGYPSSVTVTSNSATFKTYAAPTAPTASISPTAISISTASTITLTATGSSAPSGLTYTYQWYYGAGSTASSSDTAISGATSLSSTWSIPATLFTTAGTRIVYVKVTDSLGQTKNSNLVTLTINPKAPTIGTLSVSPNKGKVGTSYTPTFTFSISNLGGATNSYKLQKYTNGAWADTTSTGTATATGTKTLTYTFTDSTASTTQYRILVTSKSYESTYTSTSNTVTFTTYSAPTAPVINEPNPASIFIAEAETVSLSASSIPTAPSGLTYTYQWYYSTSNAVTSSDTLIGTWSNTASPYSWSITSTQFPTAQTVYVYLKVTDSLSQSVTSNLKSFVVSDLVASASFTGTGHGLGDTIKLELEGTTSQSIQWYYAVSGTTNWQTITGATTQTYTATATSMGLTTGTYYFKVQVGSNVLTTNSLSVYADPIPNTPGSPLTPVAVPYTITLTASCQNEQVVESYKWQLQNGDTWQDVATGQQYEPTLTTPGNYVYRFVAIGKSGNSVNSASVTVQAGYKPSATITSPASGTTFDVGERINIQATVGGTSASYTWNFGNGVSEHGTTTGTINAESTTISTYVKYNSNKKGQKTITLTVSNIYGNTATYYISVNNGKSTRRDVATGTVTEVDSSGIYNLINNTAPMSASNPMPNLSAMVSDVTQPITSIIGEWFYLLIFAVPYLIIFIRQKNLLIPSILGVLFAGALLILLPGVALKAAIGILVLSIAGGVFGLYVKRQS